MFLAFSATGCMAAKSAAPPPGPIGPEQTTEKAAASAAPTTGAADNPIVPPAEKKSIEPEKADSNSKGDPADDASDEAGLGLSGVGNGGGGTGEGTIGLGSIGTIGRGAGSGKGQGYGSGAGDPLSSGKKGRVAAATATTSGTGLANEAIARVVKGNLSAISKCYEKAMARLPSLSGKVAVKFTIDAKGAVLSAAPGDTNITDADMVSCVVGAVKLMTFPQPDGGGVVVVTYPFVFAPVDP